MSQLQGDILAQIVSEKRLEVKERRELYPTKLLEQSIYFASPTLSLRRYLLRQDKVGIIAEIKRKSPSKGIFNKYLSVEQVSIGYMQAGASALSILTDTMFFNGSNEDLITARRFNFCPILRKDFILDEYQVLEAKSIGADVVLLIAAILSPQKIKALSLQAKALGLETLLEVHNEAELLRSMCEHIDLIGVNNRDLKTFNTNIETSLRLAQHIPQEFVKVSESGIENVESIVQLKSAGYAGFLMGEAFMKASQPERVCAKLVRELRATSNFSNSERP